MKKIILFTFALGLFFSSCEDKESMGVSKITTYATLELNGDEEIFWPLNTPFVDPGCVAKEGDTDISSKIAVTSDVNVTKGGNYTINYKVLNGDGFAANATRIVRVYDASAPLNGYYSSSVTRNNNGVIANRGPFTILIFGVGNDQYYIEDLLGGWYYFGSNYGPAYAGSGIIKLNTDNTFTIVSADKLAWGYPCLFTAPSTYDPATKTLLLNTRMEDTPTMLFTVTLKTPTPLN
ncbi:MAG: BT_2262 family domain-containing protein [Paludibacter sp.]